MFTGIIEALGRIVDVARTPGGLRMTVGADLASGLTPGESVAVNGVCLTVVEAAGRSITFDVSPETARVTTLGALESGALVNLERSLRADARLGGHFVQGHVDATGCVEQIRPEADCQRLTLSFPPQLASYIVRKGSIAVDGISLT